MLMLYIVDIQLTNDKLPHNFQQHLCNYLLCPSQNFVSFRVKLLCMSFQIAVEEVIMISRHKSVGFSLSEH